jgi:hypothetical protein
VVVVRTGAVLEGEEDSAVVGDAGTVAVIVVVVVVVVDGGGGRVITGAARSAEHAVAIAASAMVNDAAAVRPALRCTRP